VPAWLAALVATMTAQTAASFLTRLVPTIAPILIDEIGLTPALVGHIVAAGSLGSALFLLAGNSLVRRTGPVRALQLGLLLAMAGVALLAIPFWPAVMIASVLIGFGYAPSTPAGSEILQSHAPARHRSLIFSIKQAGVPLGGVFAGLALPTLALAIDWRATLWFAGAVALVTAAALEPLRSRFDEGRQKRFDRLTSRWFIQQLDPRRSLAILGSSPGLVRLTFSGACFAFAQGAWFAYFVTYLVAALDTSLVAAGSAFSVMQVAGIFGRIVLGMVADRLGSARSTLAGSALAAATISVVFAWLPQDCGFAAVLVLAAISGLAISSWNGIQLAEVARISPAGMISETASASVLYTFIGYILGPVGFAATLELTSSYRQAFLMVAVVSMLPLGALGARPRP